MSSDEDFSGCTPRAELESLSHEELVSLAMRQERDCVRMMRALDKAYKNTREAVVEVFDLLAPVRHGPR